MRNREWYEEAMFDLELKLAAERAQRAYDEYIEAKRKYDLHAKIFTEHGIVNTSKLYEKEKDLAKAHFERMSGDYYILMKQKEERDAVRTNDERP